MKSFLKPMGVRDTLDCTFSILRERFWTFQGVIFYSFLPALVFFLIALVFVAVIVINTFFSTMPLNWTDSRFWSEVGQNIGIPGVILLVFLGILWFLSTMVGGFFFMHGSINVFIHGMHGWKITWRESFKGLKKKWLWYFVYFILSYIASMIISLPNMVFSFVAIFAKSIVIQIVSQIVTTILQIILRFLICLTPIVIAAEDIDAIKAFVRAFNLPAGYRWRMLGKLILVYLMVYALILVMFGIIAIPIVIAVTIPHLITLIIAVLIGLCSLLIISVFMPFLYGPLVAIYYDLIIRKEGYDLALQLNQNPNNPDTNLINRSI